MGPKRAKVDGWSFAPGQVMTPAEVARAFRVKPRTVIYWADKGLLTAVRTPGGTRRYSREQVVALLRASGRERRL